VSQHAVLEQHCKAQGTPCVVQAPQTCGLNLTQAWWQSPQSGPVLLGVSRVVRCFFATDVEASVFQER